jgi:hypothetical protein
VVSLLKIELLSTAESLDSGEFYSGKDVASCAASQLIILVLLKMVRTIVLNDTNFKTIMHHIHKLKKSRYVSAPLNVPHAHMT